MFLFRICRRPRLATFPLPWFDWEKKVTLMLLASRAGEFLDRGLKLWINEDGSLTGWGVATIVVLVLRYLWGTQADSDERRRKADSDERRRKAYYDKWRWFFEIQLPRQLFLFVLIPIVGSQVSLHCFSGFSRCAEKFSAGLVGCSGNPLGTRSLLCPPKHQPNAGHYC